MLALPTLIQGQFLDDHLLYAATLRGDSPLRFELLHGSIAELREQGTLGWWASDELQLSFMRPLAALTHALDFSWWPRALWLMHLENVLLYALLILVVGRVLQKLFGPGPIAGLACLMFAIDEVHATTVMWISGRNTIMAALFGVLALAAHMRWREHPDGGGRRWPFALAGPLCFALALLSAEAGVMGFGYLLAFSLTRERGSWSSRIAPLLPYLTIMLVWRLAYAKLGFGAHASGLYIDPTDDPLALLSAFVIRTPALGFTALSLPLADLLTSAPELAWLLGLGFVALAWALAPLHTDRDARFLALGMLGAAVPLAATAPTSRTMLILGLGSAGLAAIAWERRHEAAFTGRARQLGVRFVAVCHLVIAPLLFVPMSFAPTLAEPPHHAIAAAVPDSDSDQVVALLNVPMEINALYPAAMRERAGGRWPAHCYLLFAGLGAITVERVDANTLELRADAGWAAARVDQLSRDWRRESVPRERLAEGRVELQRATVEVQAVTEDGRPTQVQLRFDDDLDDVVLLGFDGPTLIRWTPAIGERVVLTASLSPAPGS